MPLSADPSSSSRHPQFLRELQWNERHAGGCFPLKKNPLPSSFIPLFPLHTRYMFILFYVGPFPPVTPPPTPHLEEAEGILKVLVRRTFSLC